MGWRRLYVSIYRCWVMEGDKKSAQVVNVVEGDEVVMSAKGEQ